MIAATQPAVANPYRHVAMVQGLYFLVTGVWPLVSIQSFMAVTGPKTDYWLVYTVAVLVISIGSALLVAAFSNRMTPEVAIMAIGSAVGLAAIDVLFVARGVISWVYLLDAIAEIGLIIWWAMSYIGPPRMRTNQPDFSRVQALMARGHSVSPNTGTHVTAAH
jgi:hypothetical protein